MRIAIITILIFITSITGHAQKQWFIAKDKDLEKSEKLIPKLHIIDYNLTDVNLGTKLILNEKGQYMYSDSSLVNAVMYLYLTKTDETDSVYGWLSGKIVNGQKEGPWHKAVYVKRKKSAIVQEMNFTKGVLDGTFNVYNIKGEKLFFSECSNTKETSVLKTGSGYYYDFFYDTGSVKVLGRLQNGKKEGQWYVFDKKGEVIKVDTYSNGISIFK